MITCQRKSLAALCVFSIGMGACTDICPEPEDEDSACVDSPIGSSTSYQWITISRQKVRRPGRRAFARESCNSNDECAGSINLDAVALGDQVDLLIQVDSNHVLLRGPYLGDDGLADMAALIRELSSTSTYEYPNFAGKLSDLNGDIEVEVNGRFINASSIDTWIRADGLYLQLPGEPYPLVRYGFPSTVCDSPAQVGSVCGEGEISWRLTPTVACWRE